MNRPNCTPSWNRSAVQITMCCWWHLHRMPNAKRKCEQERQQNNTNGRKRERKRASPLVSFSLTNHMETVARDDPVTFTYFLNDTKRKQSTAESINNVCISIDWKAWVLKSMHDARVGDWFFHRVELGHKAPNKDIDECPMQTVYPYKSFY